MGWGGIESGATETRKERKIAGARENIGTFNVLTCTRRLECECLALEMPRHEGQQQHTKYTDWNEQADAASQRPRPEWPPQQAHDRRANDDWPAVEPASAKHD